MARARSLSTKELRDRPARRVAMVAAPPWGTVCSYLRVRDDAFPTHTEVTATKAFWIALIIGVLIQIYKGFHEYVTKRHWNMRRFVETGGMPSSHAASVAALSTSIGIQAGFTSLLFGLTLYFSLLIMYDAAGLRRAAGRQASILNRLIDEHFRHPELATQKLMELLGHTPLEVFVGGVIGIAAALFWHWIL